MGEIAGPIVGIDVGEDFLDLAIIDAIGRRLRLARVAVTGVESFGEVASSGSTKHEGAIGELCRRLLAAAPELGESGAVAMVDSPRWPRDLDLSVRMGDSDSRCYGSASASRTIDVALRALVNDVGLRRSDGRPFRLSLFPTPPLMYFAAVVRDPRCKPHLAALGEELFDRMLDRFEAGTAPAGGRIFTRFMIAGFATFKALDRTGVESYEAYPDLAFRLWSNGIDIPPKSAGKRALEVRTQIDRRLADELGCSGAEDIATFDGADAAMIALSAAIAQRRGAIVVLEDPREGRFALALDAVQATRSSSKAIRDANCY
ncbi:MAG: DUF429 domain-containing protein [Deltaproteobacteria bacterium]|nr:DUF429 domain-containing protein [Deltaproteobacteria bacterium]